MGWGSRSTNLGSRACVCMCVLSGCMGGGGGRNQGLLSSEGPFLGGPPGSSGATRALNRVKEQICLQRGFSSIPGAMERFYPSIQLPPDLCRLWMSIMPRSLTPGSDLSPLTPHPLLPSLPGRGWEASQSQRPLAPPLASMTWNV